ncbi:hypothetical protein ACVBE9_11795 [Eionea flava]
MKKVIDIERYKNKVYLELCLDLVEDAYQSLQKGRYDYVESQLKDILEIFDRDTLKNDRVDFIHQVLPFTPPDNR